MNRSLLLSLLLAASCVAGPVINVSYLLQSLKNGSYIVLFCFRTRSLPLFQKEMVRIITSLMSQPSSKLTLLYRRFLWRCDDRIPVCKRSSGKGLFGCQQSQVICLSFGAGGVSQFGFWQTPWRCCSEGLWHFSIWPDRCGRQKPGVRNIFWQSWLPYENESNHHS